MSISKQRRLLDAVGKYACWESPDYAWKCDAIVSSGFLQVVCEHFATLPDEDVDAFIKWIAE